jgi:hypothetical protein
MQSQQPWFKSLPPQRTPSPEKETISLRVLGALSGERLFCGKDIVEWPD